MRWLIDTNVLSESIRPRPDRNVLQWIAAQDFRDTVISVVTIAEIVEGIAVAPTAERRNKLSAWLDNTVRPMFAGRTLDLTVEILADWLMLARRLARAGKSQEAPDLLIASTARIHNLVVVTRNHGDFASCGVVVFNPWTGETYGAEE